nr:winged helix-turn-helix domain-containing protein [Aliikangiella sp. G2MR2-5]
MILPKQDTEETYKTIRFNDCILDSETQILHTEKGKVRLRNKLWLLMHTLLNHSNKVVTRNFLVKHIWNGNSYTGEQGLTHAICHLRRVLKRYDIPAKIITLPKKGYILEREEQASSSFESNIDFSQSVDIFNPPASRYINTQFGHHNIFK